MRTAMDPQAAPTTTGATPAASAGDKDAGTAPASKAGLGEGVQATPIEEIAPEVELAPPAEPPSQANIEMVETGLDSLMVEGSEGMLEKVTSLPTNEELPELVRPNQPDLSLVDAARRATEANPDSASEGPSGSTSASE